jgi:hypothetical protein
VYYAFHLLPSCQHLLYYIGFLHHATFHSNNVEIIYNRGEAGPKFDVTLVEEERGRRSRKMMMRRTRRRIRMMMTKRRQKIGAAA